MTEKNNQHKILTERSPWTNNPNPIWLASKLRLYRNIENFEFPGCLTDERRKQIISLIGSELKRVKVLKNPQLVKAETVDPIEKEFLFEHYLTIQNLQQAHAGEAFIVDETGQFLGILNVKDHVQLQLLDIKGEMEKTLTRLIEIEKEMGKNIHYAFSSRWGFLTSDPSHSGTGLLASVFLHTPALIHTGLLQEALDRLQEDGVYVTGLQGDPKEMIGDLLVVQNNYSLGVTEDAIISSLRTYATKLQGQERSARSSIVESGNTKIKDKVSRAFAILQHSYQMDAIEALESISLMKLGLDLGWVTGITMTKLNELFFDCRRAHLLSLQTKKVDQEELPHVRAEFIHEFLSQASLRI